MKKIFTIIFIAITTFFFVSGQNISSSRLLVSNEKLSSELTLMPSFASLLQENQKIKLDSVVTNNAYAKTNQTDNLKTDEINLKASGYFLKKGGSQVIAGTLTPIICSALGTLLLIAGASKTTTTYNSYGSSTTSTSSDSGIQAMGTIVILGGFTAGIILNISGGVNIRKAGKILSGERVY